MRMFIEVETTDGELQLLNVSNIVRVVDDGRGGGCLLFTNEHYTENDDITCTIETTESYKSVKAKISKALSCAS